MGFQLDKHIVDQQPNRTRKKTTVSDLLQKEITFFGKVFSNKVKEGFYTELGVLLKAGITLKEALDLLVDSFKKKTQKRIVKTLSERIIEGQSMSEVMMSIKDFTSYEYVSVKIGEETGTLATVMEQLGEFYAKKNTQKRQIVNALTYPIIILTTGFLVLIFMLSYVVPMFKDIFEQQKVELPGITKMIISFSEFVQTNGIYLLLLAAALLITQLIMKKKLWFKKYKDQLIINIPFIGSFVKLVYLTQFTQAVSLLMASKVPLVNSIQLVKKMIAFTPINKALHDVEVDVLKGSPLSTCLAKHKIFNPKMIALVKVAEETNQNEFIFQRLNEQYTIQVEQRSKLLSTVMEPVIILVVGIIVGVILIAMYLPMFKLSSVLG